MHDDSNIRSLFSTEHPAPVRNTDEVTHSDVERRVLLRRESDSKDKIRDKANGELKLVSNLDEYDDEVAEDTVCELPISAETVAFRSQLAILRQEHQDLDDSIHALQQLLLPDQILLARLKRKKLWLRDQIAKIEDKINPDIIA
jgi:hypothetical protein